MLLRLFLMPLQVFLACEQCLTDRAHPELPPVLRLHVTNIVHLLSLDSITLNHLLFKLPGLPECLHDPLHDNVTVEQSRHQRLIPLVLLQLLKLRREVSVHYLMLFVLLDRHCRGVTPDLLT